MYISDTCYFLIQTIASLSVPCHTLVALSAHLRTSPLPLYFSFNFLRAKIIWRHCCSQISNSFLILASTTLVWLINFILLYLLLFASAFLFFKIDKRTLSQASSHSLNFCWTNYGSYKLTAVSPSTFTPLKPSSSSEPSSLHPCYFLLHKSTPFLPSHPSLVSAPQNALSSSLHLSLVSKFPSPYLSSITFTCCTSFPSALSR